MEPRAGRGQRTLFQVGCTKRKRTAEDEGPRELCTRLNPELAARVEEHEKQVAAAMAARTPPPPPRPVGRPRILPAVQAPLTPKVLWVQLLPIRLPSCQERVSLRLHFTQQATAAAEKQAKYDAQRVWLKVVVHGKHTVGVTLRASPFPLRKQWSEWAKEFGISMA